MQERDIESTHHHPGTSDKLAASFLAASVPMEVGRAVRQGARSGNGFCYRHNPKNDHCRAQTANESLMADIQKTLERFPESDKAAIAHIWSSFSAADPTKRQLILQGLLAQCCFPQLSFIASCTRDLIRIDFISALPTEIGFKILSHLDASSLCKAAQVSKRWAELANDDVVWHRMCEQHIDRKCVKCGWGLPLLERKRLRASRQRIAERAEKLAQTQAMEASSSEASRKRSWSEAERVMQPVLQRCATLDDCNPTLATRPWKEVYCERQKIESNWRRGRYELSSLKGHTDGVMCLQADESVVASGSYDSTIRIWDISTGQELQCLNGHTRGVNAIQFDDSKLISGSMDKTIKIWNYRTGVCISTLQGHTEGVLSLHFDDTLLVTGGADHTVRLWNFIDNKCTVLRGHTGWVNAVRVHTLCQVLFSASDDTTFKMWSTKDATCIRTFAGHVGQIQSISPIPHSVSDDEPYSKQMSRCPASYFTSSLDGTIKWWDVKTGECVRTLFGHVEGVWSVVADTLRVVSGAQDRTVKVWDKNDGRCVLSLTGHAGPVNAVHLSDSKIISGSDDGQIQIWDFGKGTLHGRIVESCTDPSHAHHPDRHTTSSST